VIPGELSLWWADQGAAADYQPDLLSAADARRASALRSAKARDDWQVSRALLQQVRADAHPAHALSLSHSGGHALCAQAPRDWAVGVDLERVRARDTAALAAWVCSEPERAWLAQAADTAARLERFYMLWTLKEAFVKAAGLDFPADMASIGLTPAASGRLALRPPAGRWQAMCWGLGGDWVMAAAWRGADPAPVRIGWRAAAGCAWPARRLLGEWTGQAA
jgi:4'-phosphopantetheinyl transferase